MYAGIPSLAPLSLGSNYRVGHLKFGQFTRVLSHLGYIGLCGSNRVWFFSHLIINFCHFGHK